MKLIPNLEKINTYQRLLTAIMVISVDQVLKYLSINIFERFVFNKGVSFGLLANSSSSLILSAIALGVLIYLIYRSKLNWSYLFIIAGGISNLFDRVIYGAVVDYINFLDIIWFNLADLYINIGILVILVLLIKEVFIKKENE